MKKIMFVIALVISSSLMLNAAKIEKSAYASLLGKKLEQKEMQKFIDDLGEYPEIKKYENEFYYNFKNSGIAMRFDRKSRTLVMLYFYSDGKDGFRQYRGKLPFGLTFFDTLRETKQRLGKPGNQGCGTVSKYVATSDWMEYDSKGIGIDFAGVNCDKSAQISIIYIYKKDK